MKSKNNLPSFLNHTTLRIMGILLVLLLAVALLWHGNATSQQAAQAMSAQVYFDGEYRIADGAWQEIVEGEHIPATKGDVTLRGNFHMLTPDGEYVGLYAGEIPIACYVNHIHLTFFEAGQEPYAADMENPLFGDSACGVDWTAYNLISQSEEPIEILIHNPHQFGNETAIDDFLSNTVFWIGIEFETGVLDSGDLQREVGLLFLIFALLFLGIALFSTLIHIKNGKILWVLGIVILFAGTYLSYSAAGVSFWNDSIVSNTIILGASMMFYMLFLTMALVHFLKGTKRIGTITVALIGILDAACFVLPMVSDILFYDTWFYWALAQMLANLVLFACLIRESVMAKGKERWTYVSMVLPLVAFGLDVIMTGLGLWKGGRASGVVFIAFFAVAMIAVLRVIPNSINTLAKAKDLETEKLVLNAQLTESRVSTMMSQIRPHCI